MIRRQVIAVLVLLMLAAGPRLAAASSIGFYGGNAAGAITSSGNTAVLLSNLTAGDLAGLPVLWLFNRNNNGLDITIANNLAAIFQFVNAGGVLSFHDRNVNQTGVSPSTYLPGAGSVTFVPDFGSDLTVLANNAVTNGITNANLDGGNSSNHGWAALATLPAGAVPVLSTGDRTRIVDFYYQYGLGWVYYSAIPLDYYLEPNGNNPPGDTFRNIYAPNEAGFQASLSSVPEPSTLLLLGGGFAALAARRRQATARRSH